MTSAHRRAREKENLRRAILDAARDLFVNEDFGSVSIRKIAEKIEYSPTAIYLYFKDKNEIFLQLMKEASEMLADRLEEHRHPDPLTTLHESVQAYVQFAVSEPNYYKIMFLVEDKGMVDFCTHHLDEICGRSFGFLLETVERLIADGIYRGPESALMLSHVIWSWMHGAAMLVLSGRLKWLPAEEHAGFINQIANSLHRFITSPPVETN